MKFLEKIKNDIRPNDLILKEVDSFILKVNSLLKKSSVKAVCVKGGSTAKGTFLKGDHDVDLFVVFDYEYKNTDISSELLRVLKPLTPVVVHGSRDYFHVTINELNYEIVPTLFVKDVDQINNVTDMSPHHVKWVNKRLNDNLRDDIRLLKRFCKAQKIYGAESYINGFSGHVIDILIIHYSGFLKFVKAASNWKAKVVIDSEHHWKDPLKNIDASKTFGPIVIVDPVQPLRNAAAAISEEKFKIMIDASKEFLKKPSKEFFELKEFNLDDVKKLSKDKTFIALKIKSLNGKIDVVGSKLLKIFEQINKQLKICGFTVFKSDWKWDKKFDSEMYFIINEKSLSKTFIREGPLVSDKKSCEKFTEKNKDYFKENKRLYANVKRRYRTPTELVKSLIKEEYIKSKVQSIKII